MPDARRDPLRALALPAGLMLAGWLALVWLTATAWLALSPSPVVPLWHTWHAPPGWNPAAGPVGIVAPHVVWSLALLDLLLVALAGSAGWAVWRARHIRHVAPDNRALLAAVLAATAIFGLILVLLPVLPSDDLFSYALYGRISAVYHANPLQATPAQFPHDPLLAHVFWKDTRAVYGPAWLLVSNAVTGIAELLGGKLGTYIALYKLLGLACHLLNAALVWAILTRLAPERRLAGTLLYAWNPLPLLEFAASGHNDALMLTFMLLGVWLIARGQEAPALIAWGASIATKYVLVILVPLYLWYVIRQTLPVEGALSRADLLTVAREIGWRAGMLLGVVLVLLIPFWAGPATLTALAASPPAQSLINSPLEALSWPVSWLIAALSGHPARAFTVNLMKTLGNLAFFAVWGYLLARRTACDIWGTWAWALLAYLTLASGWFWPWYVTWPLALVALRSFDRLTISVMLLAGGVLTLYGFMPLTASPLFGFRSVIAFGPALGYLAWTWWNGMRHSGVAVTRAQPARLGK
jgi:hypothetical protein